MEIYVFQCPQLKARLQMGQCAENWRISNPSEVAEADKNLKRAPMLPKKSPLTECNGCEIGRCHATTGVRSESVVFASISPAHNSDARAQGLAIDGKEPRAPSAYRPTFVSKRR